MTDEQVNDDIELESETAIDAEQADAPVAAAADDGAATSEPPQYGVGPFSIREVVLGGVWLVAFVVSFFSLSAVRFDSVWTSGLLWILTIGVPTAAVFLIGLRRLSPEGIRRVGSLGIDQFASVAFTVSTIVWLQLAWETVAVVVQGGPWLRTWVMWVSLVLMLAGVFLTVFAPFIPPFDQDFRGRREVAAHRNARPIRVVTPRPAPQPRPAPEPAAAQPEAILEDETPGAAGFAAGADQNDYAPDADLRTAELGEGDATAAGAAVAGAAVASAADSADADAWAPAQARDTFEPVEQAEPTEAEPVRYQAFWALAPEERDVVDERGIPIFRVGPTAWALVIEDRGAAFVVRHEDGRVGYLHDIEGVTRG